MDRQQRPGRMLRYILKNITGVELPENGEDIYETILLSPPESSEGGQHPYVLKKGPQD